MHSSPVAAIGISVLSLALAAVFVFSVYRAAPIQDAKARRRIAMLVAASAAGWMAVLALTAASGWLSNFAQRPPPMVFLMVASLTTGILLGVSRIGGWLSTLPLAWLVGWQAFRLPLELLMHKAATDGVMPEVMSYSGYNFDIVSGISALGLGLLLLTRGGLPRFVIVAWNAVGITLLTVVLGIALLSTPFVRAFGDDQINDFVAYFPYVWLPGVLVVSALMGHIVITRRLLADRRRGASDGQGRERLIEAGS